MTKNKSPHVTWKSFFGQRVFLVLKRFLSFASRSHNDSNNFAYFDNFVSRASHTVNFMLIKIIAVPGKTRSNVICHICFSCNQLGLIIYHLLSGIADDIPKKNQILSLWPRLSQVNLVGISICGVSLGELAKTSPYRAGSSNPLSRSKHWQCARGNFVSYHVYYRFSKQYLYSIVLSV